MKSEIIYQYPLTHNFNIKQVLPIDAEYTAVLCYQYPKTLKLDIIKDGAIVQTISDTLAFRDSSNISLFRYQNGFGLIHSLDDLWLWPELSARPEKVKISSPFIPDAGYEKYSDHATQVIYDADTGLFYVAIDDKKRVGAVARYWATLDMSGDKPLWSGLNALPLDSYPETSHAKYGDEWLSICDLTKAGHYLYVHTNGGSVTRLKSGPDHEFSLISKLDIPNNVIQNYPIEEGSVFFSTDKRYFILKKRSQKKLMFYNMHSFKADGELSLTPVQNLGKARGNYVRCDMLSNDLYIYNAFFFNRCKLIW